MIRTIHRIAGFTAPTIIACFWLSTVTVELVGSHATIATTKLAIVWCLPLLVGAMAAAGITGNRLGGTSTAAVIVAKRRRMIAMAANGVFVMIPCAIFLAWRAVDGMFDTTFAAIQGIELVAGPVNFLLAGFNVRAGLAMTAKRRRPR